MTLSKLGDFIEQVDNRNIDNFFSEDDVKGISTSKVFIDSKANLSGVSLSNYKIVGLNEFAYVPDTSRRGERIGLAFADLKPCIISSIYTVFKVKDESKLLPRYLMMFFSRSEFDRYARFNSWGSARETFSWEDFCDIELEIPSIEIQKKYVAIYEGLLANLRSYEKGVDDLKLVCDGYIEDLRRKMPSVIIGPYLSETNERNQRHCDLFQGIDVNMVFTEPKRVAEDKMGGKVVFRGEFAFNKVMKANCTKLPIALRDGDICVVSGSYVTFKIKKTEELLPEYLMLWLSRPETQRWAGYISYGTTRDIFDFAALSKLKIPVPDISVQNSIVCIYRAYKFRTKQLNGLKKRISSICPILIRGSILEARREKQYARV